MLLPAKKRLRFVDRVAVDWVVKNKLKFDHSCKLYRGPGLGGKSLMARIVVETLRFAVPTFRLRRRVGTERTDLAATNLPCRNSPMRPMKF